MELVKQHFESEAREFDRIIVTLIPGYREMVQALLAAIPFDAAAPIRVIDLGCGTGTVSEAVLAAFPKARVTCLDLAANMIEMARAKLSGHAHMRYAVGDVGAYGFDAEYDVVVSSLALHHLETDDDKRQCYRRIFNALAPGGVFYNADVVLASNDFLQEMYMRKWRAFMRLNVSQEEIDSKWMPTYYTEDRPAKLADHLAWLAEAGFVDVDVLWKQFNFAVYGGIKR